MITLDPLTFDKGYQKITYPTGEMQIRLGESRPPTRVTVTFEFERVDEIFELLLLGDALQRERHTIADLHLPYIPFSREDRVTAPGDALSLAVFADPLNSLRAWRVHVIDPHSDVATALIKNCCVTHQWEVFLPHFKNLESPLLVCPDGGGAQENLSTREAPSLRTGADLLQTPGCAERGHQRRGSARRKKRGHAPGLLHRGRYL